MTTLRKQLKDPVFAKWHGLKPRERTIVAKTEPWFLYVQMKKGGPWSRMEVPTWEIGIDHLTAILDKCHDAALSHKRQKFQPPRVRGQGVHLPESDHKEHWCGFCRRMTKFTYFSKHHAMPAWAEQSERRCSICGARLSFVQKGR